MYLTVQMADAGKILAPLSGMEGKIRKALRPALKRAGITLGSALAKGIKGESWLKSGVIRKSVSKPRLEESAVEVSVSGRRHGADFFRLMPSAVTPRKGKMPRQWRPAVYSIGPKFGSRQPEESGGLSKAFVVMAKGQKRMFQREHPGKGGLSRVMAVSTQYFSVFEPVRERAFESAIQTLEKRLAHEVSRILGGS